jgi:methionyl-tRNA formyltransferase
VIYLFANATFGRAFTEAAVEFAHRTGTPLTLVRSGRRPYRPGRRARLLAPLEPARRRAERIALRVRHRIPVMLVPDVNGSAFLSRIGPEDHGVSAGFDQIFRPEAIERFGSLVNLHPALLPFYRGPAPFFWCLLHGERRTGITLHRITPEIDAGEPLHQAVVEVPESGRAADLGHAVRSVAVPVVVAWLEHLASGEPWSRVVVDAGEVYRVHLDYGSFPWSVCVVPRR